MHKPLTEKFTRTMTSAQKLRFGSLSDQDSSILKRTVVFPKIYQPSDKVQTVSRWADLFQHRTHSHAIVETVSEEIPKEELAGKPFKILCSTSTVVFSSIKLDFQVRAVVPRGLHNPDNKCFLNSVLQCLLACHPLCNLLNQLKRGKITKTSFPYLSKLCVFDSSSPKYIFFQIQFI